MPAYTLTDLDENTAEFRVGGRYVGIVHRPAGVWVYSSKMIGAKLVGPKTDRESETKQTAADALFAAFAKWKKEQG